jgi:DNA-binding IclR family transcriptional regulator
VRAGRAGQRHSRLEIQGHPRRGPDLATTSPHDTRSIDDRHDRLRGLEGLLIQLEEQPHSPTPRLLALAGQLAARLPIVTRGERTVHQVQQATGLDAYLVVPSYGDVIVLASAGDEAPARWSLLPATDSAGGIVLLAHRQSWRDAQRPADDHIAIAEFEARAAEVRRDGYAVNAQGSVTSLAVPIPMEPAPLAALVLSSHTRALNDDGREALFTARRDAAERLNDASPLDP